MDLGTAEQYLKKNTGDMGGPSLERFKQALPDKERWQVLVYRCPEQH